VRITLFSIDEANHAIARIRPRLHRLRAQKREFDRLEARRSVLLIATQGAGAGNPDTLELATLETKRRRLGQVIARALGELAEEGALVKDLDTGLCDFYALRGDRLVFLCWRLDEPELAHWHGIEEGFAGRRPLKNAERD